MQKDIEAAVTDYFVRQLKQSTAHWLTHIGTAVLKNVIFAVCGLPASTPEHTMNDISYSKLMGGLKKAGVELDRKVLANMAILDPGAFTEVVKIAAEANA